MSQAGDKGNHQSKGALAGTAGTPAAFQTSQAASDLLIVSAFGRGEWLAGELANQGWKVTLADVTHLLLADAAASKRQPAEQTEAMLEAEGPFGLLAAADLPESYVARFKEESDLVPVEAGLTFWLTDGPIEMASCNASLQLARAGISRATQDYLRGPSEPGSREARRLHRQVLAEPYRQNWPAGLAHQLASSVYTENHLALEEGEASPFFAPFHIRRPTIKGREWTQNALRARGVFVRPNARILDVRVTGKVVDAVEIQDEYGSVEQAKSYVWTLTSLESQRLLAHGSSGVASEIRKDLFATLFPGGPAKPSWYWQRLRVDLGGEFAAEYAADGLPEAFVVLGDVYLPWTHANLAVLKRRSEPRAFDAWLKLPIRALAGEGDYLAKMAGEIEALLLTRMPLLAPKVSVPTALLKVPAQMVFTEAPYPDLETLAVENFFFCGPEHWAKLDWLGAYRHQVVLIGHLEKLKERWEAEARRQQAREERMKARGRSPGGDANP